MLSIDTIARVVVNASRSVTVPSSFDTGLLLIKDTNYSATKRLKSYTSSNEAAAGLVSDGFSDSSEAYNFAKSAFKLSEEYDTPVLFRMCTRMAHSQSIVETGEREDFKGFDYEKKPWKYIMAPANALKRHPFVEERTDKLTALAENCEYNRVEMSDTKLGIITAGTCYQYIKEVFGDTVSILKIGMINPLPVKMIKDFAEKVDRLIVVEELDPIIETHCNNIGVKVEGKSLFSKIGEFSQQTIREVLLNEAVESVKADSEIPVRPPVMCSGCPHRGMFYTSR